jgi:C-terminal processing protease CtpA/Prc
VKNDWLRLKLAGKERAAIRATLDKRYETLLTRDARVKSEDVFQIFMNAYATAMDPHTNYLGPRAAEDFDISMRLSLVGIGAVLQERDEYTTVRELVPGGPAALSGKIKVGDRIVGVGQGARAPVTDVLGWRLDDVVAMIRGEKNTIVTLAVLPPTPALTASRRGFRSAARKSASRPRPPKSPSSRPGTGRPDDESGSSRYRLSTKTSTPAARETRTTRALPVTSRVCSPS